MQLDKVFHGLKNVKKFKDKKPDWRDIIECIDSSRFIVPAGGNYSLKFIMVDNKDSINKIAEACQLPIINQAYFLVVVCSDSSRAVNLYGKEVGERCVKQEVGAAVQNFLISLKEKGLSSYWTRYFYEEIIKTELKIPAKVSVEAILPVGYEFESDLNKSNKEPIELDNILYFNKFKNKKMVNPKKFDS